MPERITKSLELIAPLGALVGYLVALLIGDERSFKRIVGGGCFALVAAGLAPPWVTLALHKFDLLEWAPPGVSFDGMIGLMIGLSALKAIDIYFYRLELGKRRTSAILTGDGGDHDA